MTHGVDEHIARQTFWLSFTDPDRPSGQQFLGVAVVDVTEADAVEARRHLLPQALPGAEWIGAALRKAHETGCNPGGEVGSVRIDDTAEFAAKSPHIPRHQLLSRADLERLDLSLMPETPDFDQMAQTLVGDDAQYQDARVALAAALRLVWNARGAADLATLEATVPDTISFTAG